MTKIIASYEDTTENLEFFARSKGWTPTTTENVETPTFNKDGEFIGNAIETVEKKVTLEEFISKWASTLLIREISGPITDFIYSNSFAKMEQEKKAVQETIAGNISISIEPEKEVASETIS